MTKPKLIQLSSKDQQDLIERIKTATLTDNDKVILTGLIEFNSWLQCSLHEKSISINRLQNLFFGSGSEKSSRNKKNKKSNSNKSAPDNDQPTEDKIESDISEPEPSSEITEDNDTSNSVNKGVNSGRLSHHAYSTADYIALTTSHSVGDLCPQYCCNGKLTPLPPGIVVKITGQGFAKVTKYSVQKLRCNLCGVQINANMPDNICNDKYDATFKSQLCMLKYYIGMPFYRIQGYQAALGVPLPDSTQWDLIDEVANDVHPAFKYLEVLASKGDLLHSDDTSVKILANIIASSNLPATNKERKGTFTTGILSYVDNNKIYLFYSGKKHAGENIHALLKQRSQELPTPKYMCDALSRNTPAELKHI